jgi:hypothetical protein
MKVIIKHIDRMEKGRMKEHLAIANYFLERLRGLLRWKRHHD